MNFNGTDHKVNTSETSALPRSCHVNKYPLFKAAFNFPIKENKLNVIYDKKITDSFHINDAVTD